jgi:hypothetical protein
MNPDSRHPGFLLIGCQENPSLKNKSTLYIQAEEGNRTPDPLFTKQLLYRLSYFGKNHP